MKRLILIGMILQRLDSRFRGNDIGGDKMDEILEILEKDARGCPGRDCQDDKEGCL